MTLRHILNAGSYPEHFSTKADIVFMVRECDKIKKWSPFNGPGKRENSLEFWKYASDCLTFEHIEDSVRWSALLDEVALAHSVQAFGYGQAKASTGWRVKRVLIHNGQQAVAIVQALEKHLLGIRIATRINRGPLFLIRNPDDALIIKVYRAICERWGRMPYGILLIGPALEKNQHNQALMAQAGLHPRAANGWGSSRLNLDHDIDAIFDSFARNWRKSIRSALRAGVTVRIAKSEADHEWMIERHQANMVEKNFWGPSGAFLRSLRAHSGSDYVLFQARHEDNPVAGLVVFKFGQVADSIVAWLGHEGRRIKAGKVIFWAAIVEMQRRGCLSYDVGGINSDKGFSTFKAGMRGTQYFLLNEYISF